MEITMTTKETIKETMVLGGIEAEVLKDLTLEQALRKGYRPATYADILEGKDKFCWIRQEKGDSQLIDEFLENENKFITLLEQPETLNKKLKKIKIKPSIKPSISSF